MLRAASRAGLAALLAAAACAPAAPPDAAAPEPAPSEAAPSGAGADTGPLVLRPGDSLMRHAERLEVLRRPASNLPPALADAVAQADALVVVDAAAFGAGAAAPAALAGWWSAQGLPGVPRRFEAPLGAPLATSIGRIEVDADGTRLLPLSGARATELGLPDLIDVFLDAPSGRIVAADRGRLTLLATEPPARLTIRLRERVREALAPREPSAGARPGRPRRAALGAVDRPVLPVPAPCELAWRDVVLAGDALELSLGVEDVALRRQGASTFVASGVSDGVTFALDATVDGTRRRLWSRHVPPAPRFEPVRVPLGDLAGRALSLHLVTEPGPADDPSFDYAVVGELRVTGPRAHPPARPHVVLVVIDTLRADRVGPRADGTTLTPALDAWAAREATVFTDALSTASWTYPATASLLSGLAPHQHGALSRKDRWDDVAASRSLAALLHASGYETRAATDGGFVSPVFGFAHGFDRFDATRDPRTWHTEPDWERPLAFLETRRGERSVLVLLHSYIVHDPYQPDAEVEAGAPGGLGALAGAPIGHVNVIGPVQQGALELDAVARRHVEQLYDAGVRRMDAALGRALARVGAAFGDEPYLVVVTSDHGEEFFEHGALGHGHSLFDELLRVPLLVRFPDGRAPGRDGRPVTLLDVVPTVLAAAGLPIPPDLPGHALQEAAPRASGPRVAAHEGGVHAIRWQGLKAIVGGARDPPRLAPALFDVLRDPAERVDLSDARPDRAAALRSALDDFLRAWPPSTLAGATGEVDPATAADLRALGYVGER